jgi:transcriptional regulator with XRE-family HTH domain
MKELLEKMLRERGLKPSTFAKSIGIKSSTIDDILKGKTNELNIGVGKVIRIAQGLGITVEELYGQNVPMLSEAEWKILHLFGDLNAEGQEKLMDYANDLFASGRYKKADFSELVEDEA